MLRISNNYAILIAFILPFVTVMDSFPHCAYIMWYVVLILGTTKDKACVKCPVTMTESPDSCRPSITEDMPSSGGFHTFNNTIQAPGSSVISPSVISVFIGATVSTMFLEIVFPILDKLAFKITFLLHP